MPRSIPKTDFSSIQKAIQDAFDTYWGVRGQREQRGENEKQRNAMMQQTMMGERGATERTRMGEAGAMARAQLGAGVDRDRLKAEIEHWNAMEEIARAKIKDELKLGKQTSYLQLLTGMEPKLQGEVQTIRDAINSGNFQLLTRFPWFSSDKLKGLMKLSPELRESEVMRLWEIYYTNDPVYKQIWDMGTVNPKQYLRNFTGGQSAGPAPISAEATEGQINQNLEPSFVQPWSGKPQQELQQRRYGENVPGAVTAPNPFQKLNSNIDNVWQQFLNRFKKK